MYGNKYSLPSAVFLEDDGRLLVGQAAMNSRKKKPQNFRMEFKRDLGQEIPVLIGNKSFMPEALYTEFFRHMSACVKKVSDEPIEKAYITYPAAFGKQKQQKIISAAKVAGLFNIELVDEPTAAAMSCHAKQDWKDGENLLIYDFGGGTFDVSLLTFKNQKFELLAQPRGLEHCGGIDMDRMIFGDMLGRIDAKTLELMKENPLKQRRFQNQLAELAVRAKHHLSSADIFEDYIEAAMEDIPYTLTIEYFNGMIAGMVGQTVEACRDLIKTAGIDVKDLSLILMVGGTSRVPLVQKMVGQFAGGVPVHCAEDMELAIARGALAMENYGNSPEDLIRKVVSAAGQAAAEHGGAGALPAGHEAAGHEAAGQASAEHGGAGMPSAELEAAWQQTSAEHEPAGPPPTEHAFVGAPSADYGPAASASGKDILELEAEESAEYDMITDYVSEPDNGPAGTGRCTKSDVASAAAKVMAVARLVNILKQLGSRRTAESDAFPAVVKSGTKTPVAAEAGASPPAAAAVKASAKPSTSAESDAKTPPPAALAVNTPGLVNDFIQNLAKIKRNQGAFKEDTLQQLKINLKVPGNVWVLLAHDETYLHSGKNGYILTNRGIYVREVWSEPLFISWKAFSEGEVIEKETYALFKSKEKIRCYHLYDRQGDGQPGFWRGLHSFLRSHGR